ncbi:hypothetical protein CCR75_006713 [Bremia lactucae]|uniref:Uncharacterized protein n=1 Tax=Bremia lactucae TaxID=4779 RepID=A0A976FF23_BRELC|nr:hypothetical protein CCR75_006713 [Bremia lactucae]
MSRKVIVYSQVAQLWSKDAHQSFELGLLLGYVSSSNIEDFVLAVTAVPPESESNEAPTCLRDVSVEWVQEVAQQVDRLLPGGIDIMGLYVNSIQDVSNQLVPYLRATAAAVAQPLDVCGSESIHYLAMVSTNGDVCFQSFTNLKDVKSTRMLPAKVVTATKEIEFKQYRTLIDLDELIPGTDVAPCAAIPASKVAEKFMNELEKHLEPLIRRVEASIAVSKSKEVSDVQHIKLLEIPAWESQSHIEAPLGGIHGAINCIAFVPESELNAYEMAVKYLKRDFVKSLLIRVDMARERWGENDEVKPNTVFQKGGVIQFAQRGLVPWRSAAALNTQFMASVHVFADEDAEIAVKNAFEILGDLSKSNGANWSPIETTIQLRKDSTCVMITTEPSKFIYYLLPLLLVLLLLGIQNILFTMWLPGVHNLIHCAKCPDDVASVKYTGLDSKLGKCLALIMNDRHVVVIGKLLPFLALLRLQLALLEHSIFHCAYRAINLLEMSWQFWHFSRFLSQLAMRRRGKSCGCSRSKAPDEDGEGVVRHPDGERELPEASNTGLCLLVFSTGSDLTEVKRILFASF